ncbi:MAG TPA: hypothetical protein PKM43_10060 [Verrucomicrobiota bacterium]|nr:hypothetical protein [Verrucomicrobiota bacterium]HRZ34860.1 hypothetical protein [Candidatus Paceibacterota bacterium]HRZ55839.1 hypothetical protein [Candidatus Paceibacterota bacterium]
MKTPQADHAILVPLSPSGAIGEGTLSVAVRHGRPRLADVVRFPRESLR